MQEAPLGEVFTAGLDLAAAVIRRYSMIYLLCGVLPLKERWVKRERWVPAGFVAVSMAFERLFLKLVDSLLLWQINNFTIGVSRPLPK